MTTAVQPRRRTLQLYGFAVSRQMSNQPVKTTAARRSKGSSERLPLHATSLAGLMLLAGLLASCPALALDGRETPANDKAPLQALTFKDPAQAWRRYQEGTRAGGDASRSLDALRYAADGGEPMAQWKLGSLYAAGEGGLPRDELKAFQYFMQIIDNYDEDSSDQRRDAAIVASAFVSVGVYTLSGIPNSKVEANPDRAMELFYYAATRFRDANAQYNLARMYLDGNGVDKDVKQAARWLNLAADKEHKEARAVLGSMLFKGTEGVPRQRPLGLMYLTLAREAATSSKKDAWILDLETAAETVASEDDKAIAKRFLDNYTTRVAGNARAPMRFSPGSGPLAAAPVQASNSAAAQAGDAGVVPLRASNKPD